MGRHIEANTQRRHYGTVDGQQTHDEPTFHERTNLHLEEKMTSAS
ncbi:hypothetical protein [Paenibacillus fonticola]|nr:hypothetical protein [Paenibacillus fonticola]